MIGRRFPILSDYRERVGEPDMEWRITPPAGWLTGWSLADPEKPELKPCPFPDCGGTGDPEVRTDAAGSVYVVHSCGVEGPPRATEAEAIEAWNKRGGGGGHE